MAVLFIKRNNNYIKPFKGTYDEFAIYTKAIPSASSIYQNLVAGNSIPFTGNVFYNHGIIAITNQRAELGPANAITDNFTLTFDGSKDITAHSYKCVIENGEYNMTLNPTARQGHSLTNPKPQGFVTSSHFTPYITTIGLYNDKNELLATGKLGQPVKSPQDFDITFEVRFDT